MASKGISYSDATKIRTELSRTPPSFYKSKLPLSESEVTERKAKLAAYEAGKKRQQTSKFGRLLSAAEEATSVAREEGEATRMEVNNAEQSIKRHVTDELRKLQRPHSVGVTTYHVDHAAIRTTLERGGFTAAQLLNLHTAAKCICFRRRA